MCKILKSSPSHIWGGGMGSQKGGTGSQRGDVEIIYLEFSKYEFKKAHSSSEICAGITNRQGGNN